MTVNELIAQLQRYDGDLDVVFDNDYGYEIYNVWVGTLNGFWSPDPYQCVVLNGDQIGRVMR